MNKYIGIIVVIGMLVFQAVAWLMQEAAKKKEKERMKESMAQHRRQASSRDPSIVAAPADDEPSHRIQSREAPAMKPRSGSDLATRRREQLEELRKRRKAQTTQRTTQARTGTNVSVTGRVQSTPTTSQPTAVATSVPSEIAARANWREQEQKAQAVRQQQRSQTEQSQRRAAEARSRQAREAELRELRRSRGRKKMDVRPPSVIPTEPDWAEGRHPGYDRSLRVRGKVLNAKSLQDAFVMKELIDPPLALRDQSV